MEYPRTDDPLVAALQRLCNRVGGYQAVAAAANINDQSLYQIAAQKPNASTGKARSVGPSIRRRLDKAFPGWMGPQVAAERAADYTGRPDIGDNVVPLAPRSLRLALMEIGGALRRLPSDERRRVAAAVLSSWASTGGSMEYFDMLLHVLSTAELAQAGVQE
jgi:hypothetical protein